MGSPIFTLRKLTTHVVKYRISQVKMFCQIMVLSLAVASSEAMRSHLVFWNSTNPIFRVDNTEHIMDINQENLPWEYDQVNIICPFNSQEKHVIYSVSKEEFDSCRVSNPRPKIVAICDKPQNFKYFTITFRNLSPIPGGMEFKPGQDYYFISTSNRQNIHRRQGGYCSSHNMKTVFKVADNRQYKTLTKLLNKNKIMSNSPLYKSFIAPTTTTTTTTISTSTTSPPVYFYKSRTPTKRNRDSFYYYSPEEMDQLRRKAAQKKRERDYRENMEKQNWIAEKLTSSSSLISSSIIVLSSILIGQALLCL